MIKTFPLKILLASLLILASCAKEVDVPPPQCDDCPGEVPVDERLDSWETSQLLDEIQNMIANKSCASDDDCKLIGIGYTPCGHPAAFYTYSSVNVDDALLEEKARELRDLQAQGSPHDVAGVCGFISPPPPSCSEENTLEEKRCILPCYTP